MNALSQIREFASKAVTIFFWINLPILAGAGYLSGGDEWIGATGGLALLAVVAVLAHKMKPGAPATRYFHAAGMMVMVALFVYAFSGHPWQIDMHMFFFAVLAMTAAFCDWHAIVVAAFTVAVHHLGLNLVLPSAVFPEGASIVRVLVHAVIVVAQSAVLIWLTMRIVSAFEQSETALEDAETARQETEKMAAQQAEAERTAQDEKRKEMKELADRFDEKVGQLVAKLNEKTGEMRTTAHDMMSAMRDTSEESVATVGVAENASDSVTLVASSAEEMQSSSKEIAQQVSRSAEISKAAVNSAEKTDRTVQGLAEAADKIGDVVNLISDIAEQTNLLALNATIESGKGFAVVANEVKNLADQTAKATEDISAEIGHMQAITNDAVSAIKDIRDTIVEIDSVATSISAAVEEQATAMQEIARSTQQAAQGTESVKDKMTRIREITDNNGDSAGAVAQAADALSEQAGTLRQEVDSFINSVRAA